MSGEFRCTRCGEVKSSSEFKRSKSNKSGHLSFCTACEGREFDVALLDAAERLPGKTFWRLWRHYTLIPLRKYLLKELTDSVEISIVNQIIDELELDLIEFKHAVNVKLKRLYHWRKMREQARTNGRSKAVKEAHEVLGIAIPRRGESAPIDEIKKTFKSRARDCHPDLVEGREEEFLLVKTAYETLIEHYTGG